MVVYKVFFFTFHSKMAVNIPMMMQQLHYSHEGNDTGDNLMDEWTDDDASDLNTQDSDPYWFYSEESNKTEVVLGVKTVLKRIETIETMEVASHAGYGSVKRSSDLHCFFESKRARK